MIYPVITITLLTIYTTACQPNSPKEPHPIYNRREIPLSNKYNSFTTSKSVRFPESFFRNVPYSQSGHSPYLKGIQYAPLHGSFQEPIRVSNKNPLEEQSLQTNSNGSSSTTDDSNKKPRKEHLEPRLQSQYQNQNFKCINSPGQNIEVLASVSRSPGHNAVYRSFPQIVPRDKSFKTSRHNFSGKQVQANRHSENDDDEQQTHKKKAMKKINYMRPYAVYQNVDLPTTTLPFIGANQNLQPLDAMYMLNQNMAEQGLSPDKLKRQPFSPYSKFHRLHLNIARVYSPGQVPPKSPIFGNPQSLNAEEARDKPHSYQAPVINPATERKAVPFQDQEKLARFLFRLV